MDEIVLLRIGRVIKTHGVVGAILIAPDSEEPGRLLALEKVAIGMTPAESNVHALTESRLHRVKKHTGLVVKLADVTTMESAQALIGHNVYADKSDLPELDADSFFLDDLVGLNVFFDNGHQVGRIREWRDYPSQIMLVIETGTGETLVPLVVPQIVSNIDVEAGRITLQEWEGLVDG
ncbi:MAG: 16S rRNA processing protein RimM [Rhodothermales bacterium]|nr:16S rRNA processing protein RimM [Rhodothermales bacterium]